MHKLGRAPEEVIVQLKKAGVEPLRKWVDRTPHKKENPNDPDVYDEILFTDISATLWQRIQETVRAAEMKGQYPNIEEINERIFVDCVLWPDLKIEQIKAMPVGFVPSIVKVIQEKSYLIDIDIVGRVLAPDVRSTIIRDYDYWPEITPDEEKDLKEKYPTRLHKTWIERWCFVIRPMTRTDITIAGQAEDEVLSMCKAVTVWPTNPPWEKLPAGVLQALGRQANSISGWDMEGEVEEL